MASASFFTRYASSAFNRSLIAFALAIFAFGRSPALADTHWSGTLHLFGEGNVYKDFADCELEFTINDAGQISGKGNAQITSRPRAFVESDGCIFMHTVTPDTFDIAVDGRREKDQIWLMIRPLTTATIQFSRIGGPAAECKVSGRRRPRA